MPRNSTRHILMRSMVWGMRWMTRYLGFIARPIVRFYGENEIIACGLKNTAGDMCIMYTPGQHHKNHEVRVLNNGKWVTAPYRLTDNFSGSRVACLQLPDAKEHDTYKMMGIKKNGRKLSSSVITIKKETVYDPSLLDVLPTTIFRWNGAGAHDPMIYFLAVEDYSKKTCAAVYTRECFWQYPHVNNASYSVGPAVPFQLTSAHTYTAKLVLVDYDGWVSHVAEREFSL